MNRRKVLKALLGIPFIAKLFSLPTVPTVDASKPVTLPRFRWIAKIKYKDGRIEIREYAKFNPFQVISELGDDVEVVTGHTIYS